MREELQHGAFRLVCTSGTDPNSGNLIYRIHAIHESGPEAGYFNVMTFFTEEYMEFNLNGQDPQPHIKEAALEEAHRRIDEGDFTSGETYQEMFTSQS